MRASQTPSIAVCTVIEPPVPLMHASSREGFLHQRWYAIWCCGSTAPQTTVGSVEHSPRRVQGHPCIFIQDHNMLWKRCISEEAGDGLSTGPNA
jgi:hypothetical protein